MATRGEHNIGELCRTEFGSGAFLVGFGTDHGTVAAASQWDGPVEFKAVRAALPRSYERLCHTGTQATGKGQFILPFAALGGKLSEALLKPRLERAIGVIYRPETELASHYFQAILPRQFDAYIWFDATKAVTPFESVSLEGMPDTYPFGI
jgi:protein-L-isoaspartate(D-aspartate) O-methyltransferase